MTSSRLPGKVLMNIEGVPMLEHQLRRIKRSKFIKKIVVATSKDQSDNPITELCESIGVSVYRGSLQDVLERLYSAASFYKFDTVVRLTADCPLTEPSLIDEAIREFYKRDLDYLSNCRPPTFPDGLDVEVMRLEALKVASNKATLPSHREHVTPYILSMPDKFKIGNMENSVNLSAHRWTVDETNDFKFVSKVYHFLYKDNPSFNWFDILSLLRENPELTRINSGIDRNLASKKLMEIDRRLSKGEQDNR